jgi:hypothetical protein
MKYTDSDFRELLRQFEGMVRALNTRFSEEEIIKLVAMILNNHIQDGKFTEEYIHYSKSALGIRRGMGEQLNPAQQIILNNFQPRSKKI